MTENLFSYGTLQMKSVQLKNFGRKLTSYPDTLTAYEMRDCLIRDPEVVKTSGKSCHPIACFTGDHTNTVPGAVFEITQEELLNADAYEVDDYKRVRCQLKSGKSAWVYVQSGLNIDIDSLKENDIKLQLFHDCHIPALCNIASETDIWKHYRLDYSNPDFFKSTYLEKAKKSILNKTRYMFVIYYQDKIVGSTSYYDVNLSHLKLYIGYTWLHPSFWRSGVNQIVKKLLLNYAFNELKFKRVAFSIDAENQRSRLAIEKLGIPLEGVLKNDQIRNDGTSRDSALYAITKNMWNKLAT